MHPSSLWGEYSVGSFGSEAREFVDFLYECGFGVWQTLPFCITDEFNSPYKSPAAFSLNPYFIDLPDLYSQGYITKSELLTAKGEEKYLCEFERLKSERLPLLFKAAGRALQRQSVKECVEAFISDNPRIKKAASFLTASNKYNMEQPSHSIKAGEMSDTERLWQFLHYEFYREWQDLKGYANQKGIEIIGDIPIYVSLDSADVWENPENFMLDARGFPTEVGGVPPDYFSAEGQTWGNPIYNYEKMKEDGFRWWRERIRHTLSLFDGARIDHFRGIDAYWSIPQGKSAVFGEWKRGPGEALMSAICGEAGGRLLIAEDLGDIDDSVRELRTKFHLPGMRVFEFAFLGDKTSLHLPHNYINDCIAYTATHDNNTMLGYLFECDAYTRARIFKYCGYFGDSIDEGCRSVIRTLFASSAGMVILPIQDVLLFGADTRMNTPGKSFGNWAYRVTREQIMSVDRDYYKNLSELYSRI